MMTPKMRARCIELRAQNVSLRKIADEVGVSANAVWHFLSKNGNGYVPNLRTKMVCDRAIYPAIANWILEQGLSISKFSAECGTSQEAMRLMLDGTHDPSYKVITRVLECTGMTFEQAFSRRAEGE